MTPAPTLTTKRLTLRGPQKSDLGPFTDWVTTSARMDAVGGNGTAKDAWGGFIAGIGHWNWHGHGFFIVCDSETQTPRGRVGILHHVDWPAPELAWHMFDNGEGHGYAFEAAIAIRQWYAEAHSTKPLISLIVPENTRSTALAKRLQATPGDTHQMGEETPIIWTHLPADATQARAQWEQVA